MPKPRFVAHTRSVLGAQVLCGLGVNREESAPIESAELAILQEKGLRAGQKNLVRDIRRLSPEGGKQRWQIITFGSGRFVLRTGPTTYFPAGGALNIAFDLKQFGLVRPGIIGPIGRGGGGHDIVGAIEERVIPHALWAADGTAFTLAAQDDQGASTLFMVKPNDHLARKEEDWLMEADPQVLVTTSVKPGDLRLLKRLYAKLPHASKVFAPQAGLIKDTALAAQWKALAGQADYFQVNQREASLIAGKHFRPSHMPEIAALGARVSVVTMAELGAVMMIRGQKAPVIQAALSVQPKGTSGPGDAFCASMVNDLLIKVLPPELAIKRATVVAGKKVEQVCPWEGIPSEEEIQTYLELLD